MSGSGPAFGIAFADREDVLRGLLAPASGRIAVDPARSIRFDDARDAVVVGDNLEALRLLQAAYFDRVQAIYIDPPYNTGRDFVYRDRFGESEAAHLARTGQVDDVGAPLVANPSSAGRYHSAWLGMMYPRLWLARQLLRDDGVLFCSIDDHEVHHLRLLLDEIFGEDCFVAQVVVVGNRGGRDYMRIAVTHEYVLVYGATPDATIREVAKEGAPPRYKDARGAYDLRELRNRNPKFHPGNRPNLFYPVYVHPTLTDEAGGHAVSVLPSPGYDVVTEPRNRAGEGSVWRWGKPKLAGAVVLGDAAASEVVARARRDGGWNVYEKHRKTTTKARSLWGDPAVRSEVGTIELRERLGAAVFDHPKPVELVRRCVELGTDRDGIVLDFFAGSGTTAEAVRAQNERDGGTRRTVLVQYPEVTPSGSPARTAGFDTVADVLHARLAATGEDGPGVRWFRVADDPTPAAMPELTPARDAQAYLEALRARTDAREAAAVDPWSVAIAHGFSLDATCRVVTLREVEFVVFIDPARDATLACTDAQAVTAQDVEALDLPPRSTLAVRTGALEDAVRLRLCSRYLLVSP